MEPVRKINLTAFYSYVFFLQTQKISISLIEGFRDTAGNMAGSNKLSARLPAAERVSLPSSFEIASHRRVPHSREDPTDTDQRQTKNNTVTPLLVYWCQFCPPLDEARLWSLWCSWSCRIWWRHQQRTPPPPPHGTTEQQHRNADQLIREDRNIYKESLATELNVSRERAQVIIDNGLCTEKPVRIMPDIAQARRQRKQCKDWTSSASITQRTVQVWPNRTSSCSAG